MRLTALTTVAISALLVIGTAVPAHADSTVLENTQASNARASCTPAGWADGPRRGQSFTAPVSGRLTEVGFHAQNVARTTTVSVAQGVGPARVELTSQPITFPGTPTPDLTSITLASPVDVVAGQQYSVIVADISCGPGTTLETSFYIAHGTPFAGGDMLIGDGVPLSSEDLWVRFVIESVIVDTTSPTITATTSPAANAAGWNNTPVQVTFACEDDTALASCGPDATLGEGAGQSVTGIAVDESGNAAQRVVSGINVDLTPPVVSLAGGPADGVTYAAGSVPPPPDCIAEDALSGATECTIAGYATTSGTHTVTATARDAAGNTATAAATYTVTSLTVRGFFAPVDMNGVVNVAKGGSTVPLKFEVFDGAVELTDPAVVTSFIQTPVSCEDWGASTADPIEVTTTGGTSLRYDAAAGRFVQNWKTPAGQVGCYLVTMTVWGGSTVTAVFRLK
ncbi:PxKF domain-containing protein [Microbacterium sp. NEAU-LLC]|uniref:PxKF domain-containing protein n=1 Tax=Microbacterium helvum TaxID=2773713 RepID=A0ABR8NKV6_9MICO|nr:PxKF domain-containing protein [Microbacterium helvum]MBD3940558.1 PxKF domain-containing protein [Microbacterium helvum]